MPVKPSNPFYAYFIVGITLLSIFVCLFFTWPIYFAFLFILATTYAVALRLGHSSKNIFKMMVDGMSKVSKVILMLSLVGTIISLWMNFGTIPALIFYGFEYLANVNIVLASFLISSIISMVIGSAIGTLSIVVPVFIGLATGLHVPLPLIVGAMVSGAYLGDRTSPVSSSANLTAIITESNITENVKKMLVTLAPAFCISTLIYWVIGSKYIPTPSSLSAIEELQQLIVTYFNIHFTALIPIMILLFFIIVLKRNIIESLGISLFTTLILSIFIKKMPFFTLIKIGIFGYYPENKAIISLVSGSGFLSMINLFIIILISTAFNGILEGSHLIEPLFIKLKQHIKTPADLMQRAGILSVLVTIITCNQTLTAIVTGNTFKENFRSAHISTGYLARAISDFGMIMVPIIPWNINAILVRSLTGVSAMEYTPFSYFCLILPLVGFLYPYLQQALNHFEVQDKVSSS